MNSQNLWVITKNIEKIIASNWDQKVRDACIDLLAIIKELDDWNSKLATTASQLADKEKKLKYVEPNVKRSVTITRNKFNNEIADLVGSIMDLTTQKHNLEVEVEELQEKQKQLINNSRFLV